MSTERALWCLHSSAYQFEVATRFASLIFANMRLANLVPTSRWSSTARLFVQANANENKNIGPHHWPFVGDTVRFHDIIWYAVGCSCNAAIYQTSLYLAMKWQTQNMTQTLNSIDTPYLALMGELRGVYLRNLEKINRVITTPHDIVTLNGVQSSPVQYSTVITHYWIDCRVQKLSQHMYRYITHIHENIIWLQIIVFTHT